MKLNFIEANWPAPDSIRAGTSTSLNGFSRGAYASNNLALHVEDSPTDVSANRMQLKSLLGFSNEPYWLHQTHSTDVSIVEEGDGPNADASITRLKTTPLVILTADCLPIVLCDSKGTEIAAIHAGWRGLYNGIIQNTLDKMKSHPQHCMAWIGPAICQRCYETSLEVKTQFIERYPYLADTFSDRHANLPLMAERILKSCGVTQIYHSNLCTFEEKNRCYSYRRSPQTGRMGTFIWFRETL